MLKNLLIWFCVFHVHYCAVTHKLSMSRHCNIDSIWFVVPITERKWIQSRILCISWIAIFCSYPVYTTFRFRMRNTITHVASSILIVRQSWFWVVGREINMQSFGPQPRTMVTLLSFCTVLLHYWAGNTKE